MRIWREAGDVDPWRFPAPCLPHLPAMIEAAQHDMQPAGPSAINSAVRDVLSGLPAKKQGDGDAQSALLVYRIGLKDLPVDLLRLACERACTECEWRPPSATLLKLVGPELAERRRRLNRLLDAQRHPPKPQKIITDAERQAVIAGFAELKAKLAAAGEASGHPPDKGPQAVNQSSRFVVEAALAAARQPNQQGE